MRKYKKRYLYVFIGVVAAMVLSFAWQLYPDYSAKTKKSIAVAIRDRDFNIDEKGLPILAGRVKLEDLKEHYDVQEQVINFSALITGEGQSDIRLLSGEELEIPKNSFLTFDRSPNGTLNTMITYYFELLEDDDNLPTSFEIVVVHADQETVAPSEWVE